MKTDKDSLIRYLLLGLLALVGMAAVIYFVEEFLPQVWRILHYVFMLAGPFLMAWLICVVSRPLINCLHERLHVSRPLTAIIIVILSLLLMSAFAMLIIGLVASALNAVMPYVLNIGKYMTMVGDKVNEFFYTVDLDVLKYEEMFLEMQSKVTALSRQGIGSALSLVASAPEVLVWVIIALVATYYWCVNEAQIRNALSYCFPKRMRYQVRESYDQVSGIMGSYIRAQAELMAIEIGIALIGCFASGIANPVNTAVLAGILGVIPLLGPAMIVLPCSVWGFLMGDMRLAIAMLCLFLVFVIARNVLQPKIVGDHVGLHPLLALASIFVGMKVFGAAGLLLGPVVASLAVAILRDARERKHRFAAVVTPAEGESNS